MKSNKRKKRRNRYIVFLIVFTCCISIVACSLYYILGHDEYVDDILIEESISPEWLSKDEEETESEPEAETEEQVALPYGEANNLVFQTLENGLEVQSYGCIYSFLNPEATRKVVPCNITVQSVLEEQYGTRKQLTVTMELGMEGFYEPGGIELGECVTPSISLGDYYTGMVFPDRTLRQKDEMSNKVILSAQEYWQDSIDVEYSYQAEFQNGDWVARENGIKAKKMTFGVVYTVDMPADYDGLVLRIQPVSHDFDKAFHMTEELSGDYLINDTGLDENQENVSLYFLLK